MGEGLKMKQKMICFITFFIILGGLGFLLTLKSDTPLKKDELHLQIGVTPSTNSATLYYEPLITNDTTKNDNIIQDLLTIFENAKELDEVISIGGNGDLELHLYKVNTHDMLLSGNILLTDDGGIFTSRQSKTSLKLTSEDIDYIKNLIESSAE